MNWSHSVVVFSGGGARAHPPFYLGMVSNCSVIRVFLFEVWSVTVEPPSLVRTGSIRVSVVFYHSTLTLPF
jgi:hypothetical protein